MAKLDSVNVVCESCKSTFPVSIKYLCGDSPTGKQDHGLVVTCQNCRRDDVVTFTLEDSDSERG